MNDNEILVLGEDKDEEPIHEIFLVDKNKTTFSRKSVAALEETGIKNAVCI